MAAPAIDLAALSAEQMKDLLLDIKVEMRQRKRDEQREASRARRAAAVAALRQWHAEVYAAIAEVRAEKNAELVAAGKQRINAAHVAEFLRWSRTQGDVHSFATAFDSWFVTHQDRFRTLKPQPPKVKFVDLPPEERIRRFAFAAAHINKRVVDLTAEVATETATLAAVTEAKQQLRVKEHTPQQMQSANWDIEYAQRRLAKVTDLLARSKETQRKFAERHCTA